MDEPLKLISLNIQGDKHIDRILPFLRKEQPDVVCLQELPDSAIVQFEELLGPVCVFAPMFTMEGADHRQSVGVGIFSRFKVKETDVEYYINHGQATHIFDSSSYESRFETASFALVSATVEKNDVPHTILTTHMPVTEEGATTDYQRAALASLLPPLQSHAPFILCGDFNAPRGREVFGVLANLYKDNIPKEYISSLDPTFHRAGTLPYMVDGLFSTPEYHVSNVVLESGVSDHLAVCASVRKN